MSQENVEIVRRIYSAWAEGDFTVGVALLECNVTLVIDPGILDGARRVRWSGGRQGLHDQFPGCLGLSTIAAESVEGDG